jgi:tRNA acetyltransferase TAN1
MACGMSVVGNDWEALKRFNLAELYSHDEATSKAKAASNAETKPQSVTTNEKDSAAVNATNHTRP